MASEIIAQATWNENTAPDWLEKINWKHYEKLAYKGYKPEQIAMYYKIDQHEFMFYFMMIDSKLKWHYDRGQLYGQAREGMDMVADAAYNVTQAQRLDKLRDKIEFENAKNDVIYGGF